MRSGLWGIFLGAAAAASTAPSAEAADLALKRVLLSTGGVGLFEYEAEVEGDDAVELKVRRDQVDDVLKTLIAFDDHGGVGGLDLPSAEPLGETFRSLPFSAADLQSTPQLLTALRGAEVEIGGANALKGRIVSVAEDKDLSTGGKTLATRHRITVMTEAGLQSFILEQAESVRFSDPGVRASIAKALAALAANSDRDSRTLRLAAKGTGRRKLRVAYLVAAPVWKTSYRLMMDPSPDSKKAALQAWATLENISGQDWRDVDLTLVSGRPVAYRQDLYRAYMVLRPEAPVDVGAALTPEIDRGALPALKAARGAAQLGPKRSASADGFAADALRALPFAGAPAPAAPPMAGAAVAAAADEGQTQVSFHLPFPVSVANGRTLSLPIVDNEAPVMRLALYDPGVDRRHPLSAAELTNDGKSALPPGIVTLYESGEAGATYVGDSRLAATPIGEKRLAAYALDQKTTIDEDDSDNTSLARARIAKGVLTIEDLTRRKTVYRLKADAPRRIVVFVPKLDGGHLAEPKTEGVSEADGRYRIPFDVAAGDNQMFAVTQERTEQHVVALADLDDVNLQIYAKSGEVDAGSRAALVSLAALREKQAAAERALAAGQAKIEQTTADQERLKDLLGAAPAGSDLAKRYLHKLDVDESELETQRAQQGALEKARDAARKAVEDFVAGL